MKIKRKGPKSSTLSEVIARLRRAWGYGMDTWKRQRNKGWRMPE